MRRERLPASMLPHFKRIMLRGISLNGVTVTDVGAAGLGLTRTSADGSESEGPLLSVDRSLAACEETVGVAAMADKHLRQVMEKAGDFVRTPRGAVMVFLVVRMTEGIGMGDVWKEYVKFLPEVSLPTTWTEEERELLKGTSLHAAVTAKLQALSTEFDAFRSATEDIDWCRKYWWDDETLTLEDWKCADAWFRSRVLELPSIGAAMMPIMDFANHSAAANAYYDKDSRGDIVLLLRDGLALKEGEEVTIDYGSEKSAAEFLFSYGFIDAATITTASMVLTLASLADDPLAPAKEAFFKASPTVRITETSFESDFIWLTCLNEEDGLAFHVLQETNSERRKLLVTWHGEELQDPAQLRGLLEKSPLWPVYQLRAEALVEKRLELQVRAMMASEEAFQAAKGASGVAEGPWAVTMKLRELEKGLLATALERSEKQKEILFATDEVQEFLAQMQVWNATDADLS